MRFVTLSWLAALLAGVPCAFGFSYLGPINEAYQVVTLGYNLGVNDKNLVWMGGGVDLGAPKDIGQGYRRNTPVMYYAMDENWLQYFGATGQAEVDKAYAILNALPPVSQMSANLSEYPLEALRMNPTAQALYLRDLKSTVLALMVEQLGLAEPERYTWGLHDRYLPPNGKCPQDEEYVIVQRNFDPITHLPTSYVNGTLYSYTITELCDAQPPPNWRAICDIFAVDPNASAFTSVASDLLPTGALYTGLTRDDVGGIRALLETNNLVWEYAPSNSVTIVTNTSQATTVFTSNLTVFAQEALTNDAAGLMAQYPGLVIIASTNYPVYQWVTNLTFLYLTNKPFDPATTPPYIPVFATNRTLTVQINYQHTFANLVTFKPTPNGWATVPITTLSPFMGRGFVTLQTTTASLPPWDTTGLTLITNTTSRTYLTNEVVGDFAILPTNACGLQVAFPLLTNVSTVTNLLTGTNSIVGLTNNVFGSTNQGFFSQSLIQWVTNRVFWAYTVDCQTNSVARRQGIEKITFVRQEYDSWLRRLVYPITNTYTLTTVSSNGAVVPQTIQRVVTTPDFLFTAQDLDGGPATLPVGPDDSRSIQFNQSPAYPGQGGPGILEPGSTFVFNKAAPVFYNRGGNTASELTQSWGLVWGSFGMGTNAPVVYPSSLSLANLETLVLIQVSPPYLPDGLVGNAYSAQLQTQGPTPDWPNWLPPYTWALTPNSPPLPSGLSLSSDGRIAGVPTTPGDANFVLRITDAQGRTYDRSYAIHVN